MTPLLAWIAALPGALAGAPPCIRPVTAAELDKVIATVVGRFDARDLDGLHAAGIEAETALRCVNEPLTPEQAARWHAARALVATSLLDAEEALRELRAALARTPSGLAPVPLDSSPLLTQEFTLLARDPTADVPLVDVKPRRGEILWVDGEEGAPLPRALPAVLQLQLDGEEGVVTRPWTGEARPAAWRAAFRPEGGARRWVLAGSAGALAVGAGAVYAVGLVNVARFEDDPPRQEIPTLYARSHALTWVAAGAGVGALGLGVTAVVMW